VAHDRPGQGRADHAQRVLDPGQGLHPKKYDPDKWLKAAKKAGFVYAVLTTRHHEGFALWPSHYGDFNTKNFMGGRDLLKDYVAACRRNGIKVGFYYSPPDWYFDREFMNFTASRTCPRAGRTGSRGRPRSRPRRSPSTGPSTPPW
jgi:alpha-L-fucosidase